MKRLGIYLFAVAMGFAQTEPVTVAGTVQSVSGNRIDLSAGLQRVTVATDANTQVWKGKIFHDLSAVEAGDRLTARLHQDASGQLVAESIWLNITNFSAVITRVSGAGFDVLTNPLADPASAYKKENKSIEVDADTVFEVSAREDLRAGRDVQVVGLELRGGVVRATRVTVYEGNQPVRILSGAAVRRTAQ